jgi:hypothetical protein
MPDTTSFRGQGTTSFVVDATAAPSDLGEPQVAHGLVPVLTCGVAGNFEARLVDVLLANNLPGRQLGHATRGSDSRRTKTVELQHSISQTSGTAKFWALKSVSWAGKGA